jgi:hypothetical protein
LFLQFSQQAQIFNASNKVADRQLLQSACRVRDMGRLLMATEIRSTKTYWHVQAPDTANVSRIYPGTTAAATATTAATVALCCDV